MKYEYIFFSELSAAKKKSMKVQNNAIYSTFLNSHSPHVESKTDHFLSNPITLPGRTLNSEQILFTDLEAAVDDGLAI